MNDIFGPGSNPAKRIVTDYGELATRVAAVKELNLKVVLTSGTFDVLHIGHCRYLEQAKKSAGDPANTVLIVGVDSDARVRKRKGEGRPIVSQTERIEMLTHVRHVDLVVLKEEEHPAHHLIKTVQPDVLVKSQTTNPISEEEMAELRQWCGEVVVLESQATTSTSARLRLLVINTAQQLRTKFNALVGEMNEFFEELAGRDSS